MDGLQMSECMEGEVLAYSGIQRGNKWQLCFSSAAVPQMRGQGSLQGTKRVESHDGHVTAPSAGPVGPSNGGGEEGGCEGGHDHRRPSLSSVEYPACG